jgi:hypothetical protein
VCREPEELFWRLGVSWRGSCASTSWPSCSTTRKGVVRGDLLDARSMALAPRPEAPLAESHRRASWSRRSSRSSSPTRPSTRDSGDDAHPAGRHRELRSR